MKKVFVFIMMVMFAGIVLLTNCSQTSLSSAKIYMNQSEYDQAIGQCELAIEQKPNNPEAYFIMGQAYGFKRMYRKMNEAFIKSLEISDKYASKIEDERVKYWTNLSNNGVNALKQNRLNDAIEQFKIAIELVPDRKVPYKNMAIAYVQASDDTLAIETYLKVLKIDPTDLETKGYLGVLYLRNQDYENAITYLGQVVEQADPTSGAYSQSVFNLALCYDMEGQSDKALETYQKALEVSPNDKDLLYNMGRLYLLQENFEEAIDCFKKVIEQVPDDFNANLNVGVAYNLMEKFEEAIPYLEKAAELDPTSVQAWNQLGIALVRTGQTERGQAAFDKVQELRDVP